ncbi:hypothetical protein OTB20_19210 [Streptomyces sp. H27-H1]|uniref:hypothetical protein n=1 Tax=Streptomyces sp. H27-H1 TaxID=2996461 RepID=UPI00226DEB2D|nr:hypothetical protein [Streptomyces sp. H27-H1]MCY0928285.1 hypothetical protein [Streptomyces sp. H27-H1]
MSPTPPNPAPARSAAEVNDAIRALVGAGGVGTQAYQELLVEWAAAVRAEVAPAA